MIDGLDLISNDRLLEKTFLTCSNNISLPLETPWAEVYKHLIMFFEMNYKNIIQHWEINTVRKDYGILFEIKFKIKIVAPYVIEEIEDTMKGIVVNYGVDTSSRISGFTRNYSN